MARTIAGETSTGIQKIIRVDTNGQLIVGTAGTGATDLAKAEDAAHASGDTGVMLLAVRQDTAAALAGTDGDYIPVIVGSDGGLWARLSQPLPAGTNAIGKLAANSGVDIGDVDVTSLPSAMLDSTNVLKVSLYGKGSVAGDTALNVITPADGDALAAALRVASLQRAYNGTTVDTWRNNIEGTALASAARTAQTNSSDIITYNANKIYVFLNVTAASGTGGLTVRVQAKDPVSGNYFSINSAPTAVTSTTSNGYLIGPGVSAGGTQATSSVLPRTIRIQVQVGDSSSYTYSVGYSLIV